MPTSAASATPMPRPPTARPGTSHSTEPADPDVLDREQRAAGGRAPKITAAARRSSPGHRTDQQGRAPGGCRPCSSTATMREDQPGAPAGRGRGRPGGRARARGSTTPCRVNSSVWPSQSRRRPHGTAVARGRRAAHAAPTQRASAQRRPGRRARRRRPGRPRSRAASPARWPSISGSTSAVRAATTSTRLRAGRPAGRPGPGCRAAAAGASDERREADRDVDEEDRPPAGPARSSVDEQPADQLTGGGRHAHHGRVGAERADPVRAGVHVADQGEHGRADGGRGRALHQPRREQQCRVSGRQAAGRRARHEERDAEREHPAPAPPVREPAGDEQEAAEGEAVAGDEPLEGGVVGVRGRAASTGSATLTTKKSRTIRNVPVSRTASGPRRVPCRWWSGEVEWSCHVLRPPVTGGSTPG